MKIAQLPFYIMRHGETEWNRTNRIMGQTDIPLNERGKNQAQKAIEALRGIKFAKIWSSPLQRARQTAAIINEEFSNPLTIHDNLKERGWGVGEGESHKAFHPNMERTSQVKVDKEEVVPRGAETYKEFERRIILAFQDILIPETLPPLVVAHGGVVRVLSKLLANSAESADNCAIYHFIPHEDFGGLWQMVNLKDC